jgi:hypothetical protein
MAMRAGSTFRSAGSAWIIVAIMSGWAVSCEVAVRMGPVGWFVIGASATSGMETGGSLGTRVGPPCRGNSEKSVISGAGVCPEEEAGTAEWAVNSVCEEKQLFSHA